jgi:ferrous iron transport protein B
MSRAAFLLDKLMSRVGLHGKAFLPLISSFACAIPGIMATRTIESRRDRFCHDPHRALHELLGTSAGLYADDRDFFCGADSVRLYIVGCGSDAGDVRLGPSRSPLSVAFILKRTVLKAPPPPFIMELPPYRLPNLRTVLQNMLTRAWLFLNEPER